MASARKPKGPPPPPSPEDLAAEALRAFAELVRDPDPRIRLDAAKTIADRFGHPAMARSEITGEGVGAPPLVVNLTHEQAHEWARMSDD